MKVILKPQCLVLIPESETEAIELATWEEAHRDEVFAHQPNVGSGTVLRNLGPAVEACRIPIVISSRAATSEWRLIGNFAPTPFKMDGRLYANVEAFWQGLKFPKESDRRRLAQLPGPQARRLGQEAGYPEAVLYEGQRIVPGTWEHWNLMTQACTAKFTQNPDAATALLSTGNRPLEHRTRRDSRTIPGIIMAAIWMQIRAKLSG